MKRVLYILVLLFMFPSSLLAGKWDGYYYYGENNKSAYTVKNDKVEVGCIETRNNLEIKSKRNFKVSKQGKSVANCGDLFILLDFKNMTFKTEYRNKINYFKFTKKIPLRSLSKKSSKPPYKDSVATVFRSFSLKTRKDIQKTLKEKGLYTSSIDGLYGKGTRKAIEDYFNSRDIYRVPKNYSESDLYAELKIIANLQKVPKPYVDKIIVVEQDVIKPMKEDEARLLLSQLIQYSQDNPGAFDLDFAVEFNKVREITEGLWSDQISKNFERFRGYLAKFPDFITYVEAEKKIAEEKLKKKVASLRTELKKNVTILEEWARRNVLDEKAAQIAALSLRFGQVTNQTIEKLEKMKEGSKKLLSATGIEDKLKSAETTEAINSIYNPSSIYLFANISGDGQNIYKNLESKFAFENNRSTYCHSDKLTPFEHYLIKIDIADKFATLESIDKTECSSSTDLLIVKGNEIKSDALLTSTTGFWIIPVLKMEQVEVITELTRSQRDDKFGQLSFMKSSIKKDVMDGTRVGYGLIRVADKGDTICSVLQTQIEGHKNTLRQQGLLLNVFGLKASIDTNTSTEEDVFRMLQRGKCGVIYGSSLSLGRVYLAANSAGFEVEFLPLWIGQRSIDSESDRIEQAKLNAKQQQEQSKRNLEEQARLNAQAERTRKESAMETQRMIRESNGLRFKVLSDLLKSDAFNAIDFAFENSPLDEGYVKKYIDQPFVDKDTRYSVFDPIISDVQQLASEKWEITEKRIDQIDFGNVAFSERDLEAIILEVTVSSKNRLVGKYSDYCKRVHVIYDKDFKYWRKFQLSECEQDMVSNQWREANDFESKWIVN